MGIARTLSIALGVGLVWALWAPGSLAIMRRHDVPDSEYIVATERYPAVVDLLEPGDCLATLVAPRWLVTAAHCAEDVRLPHVVPIDGRDHDVRGVVCERGYDGDINDIALVHLERAVTTVAPIPIYRDRDEVGQLVTFVGRGDSGTGLQGQSGAMLDLKTRHATNVVSDASARWIEFVFESPKDPEATPLEGISGDGDSGGPALIETPEGTRIVGISSWQDGPESMIGLYGAHEFYTRVSSHTALVDETTGAGWDGDYRPCNPGCTVSPAGTRGPGAAGIGVALSFGLMWRRRRWWWHRQKHRRSRPPNSY